MPETSQVPFAVFGATGRQGGAVVDALLDRGAGVRAIVRTRDSDRAKRLGEYLGKPPASRNSR